MWPTSSTLAEPRSKEEEMFILLYYYIVCNAYMLRVMSSNFLSLYGELCFGLNDAMLIQVGWHSKKLSS